MESELLERLRADLEAADYRAATVEALLGTSADVARQRGVFAPARYVLAGRDSSALTALVRVFLLGERVSIAELDAALPGLEAVGAVRLGLVAPAGKRLAGRSAGFGYRAALSLNPVRVADPRAADPLDWWIISDLDDQLRRGPARPEHVMGVGGATRSLIAQAPPGDALGSALDLGTGCGIVALHLALRAERVVATDISERALTMARANAALNGMRHAIEFRQGDLFEPAAGEEFELILSNPPFVITPRSSGDEGHSEEHGGEARYEYRDGGMKGDELVASVVRRAPAHLRPGGTLLCLANWESPWGSNGLDRVRSWVEAAADEAGPVASWVIERDRVEPAQYAETWARDGGARPGTPGFEELITAWLEDFAARRVVSIGLGSIRVRRLGEADAPPGASLVHADRAAGALAVQNLGGGLDAVFDAGIRVWRMSDAEALGARWLLAASVREEREHRPGEDAPRSIALSTDSPIARRVSADPLLAAAVGACDGELTLAQIADALATLLGVDAEAARDALIDGVRELVWYGVLVPAERIPRGSVERSLE